jgi:hypothetical protein
MTALPVTVPPTVAAIWRNLERGQDTSRRTYLGASVLGDECERKLFDNFRWLFPAEIFDGQKLSIFQTGHEWEARLVRMVQAAGIDLHDTDPETGEQFAVRFAGGHGGGHLDGEATKVPEAPATVHVVEFKTHKDKSFKDLLKKGVRESKPTHHAQMQTYMGLRGRTRALYLAVNKNDDTLYAERVEFDVVEFTRLMTRAERIVTTDRRPECSCPSYFLKAGYGCAVNEGVFPARTCRSCLHATAHLDGDARWSCARHKRDLCIDEQRAGCPQHLFNPTTIPGEQIDCDETAECITYRLTTGDVWVDGGRV